MAKGDSVIQDPNITHIITMMRNLEEKQQMLSERMLLIGKNFIDEKEKNEKSTTEMKKNIKLLKSSTEKIVETLEFLQENVSKCARREDVEILSKQARMFQPLEIMEGKKNEHF